MQSSKFCQLYTYGNADSLKSIDDVKSSDYDMVNFELSWVELNQSLFCYIYFFFYLRIFLFNFKN